MKQLINRLQSLIDEKKVSVTEVADGAGLDRSSLTQLINGKRKVGAQRKTIAKLADFFDCDPIWLATGQGARRKGTVVEIGGPDKTGARQNILTRETSRRRSAVRHANTVYQPPDASKKSVQPTPPPSYVDPERNAGERQRFEQTMHAIFQGVCDWWAEEYGIESFQPADFSRLLDERFHEYADWRQRRGDIKNTAERGDQTALEEVP